MEEHLANDEQIVPFKGRRCLRQYNPRKPDKWGYKIWVLCGASGFAFDYECYTGRNDNVRSRGKAIFHLHSIQNIQPETNRKYITNTNSH